MRYIFTFLEIIAIALIISGCEKSDKNNPQTLENAERQLDQIGSSDQKATISDAQIVVYGRPSCSRCVNIMKELDRNNIAYNFYNTDENKQRNQEMWGYVKKFRLEKNGSVGLPVVVINTDQKEYAYSNPAFYEIHNLLKNQ